MDFILPLPLDQLRFNVVLRVLITAYGASGIWNFFAFTPGFDKEDEELLWYNHHSNYTFRLISSLIFLLLWISQFRHPCLIYLSIWEIYIIIFFYLYIMIKKRKYSKENREKIKEITKRNFEETHSSKS